MLAAGGAAPAARAAIAHGIPCSSAPRRDAAEARALAARSGGQGSRRRGRHKRFSPPYAGAAARGARPPQWRPSVFTGKFTLGYPYVDLLAGGTVHLLDLMRWLMGPVGQLHARAIGHAEAPASVVLSVRFVSGAIGTLMTSATGLSFKPWERVELLGAQALLVVDDQYELTLFDDELGPAKSWRPAIPNTLMFDEEFGGYVGLLAHVADAVRGLVPLSVTADDGAAAVTLIDAIRRSIASGREIDLSREGLAA